MLTETNKIIFRRLFEEVTNTRNIDAADTFFAPNYVNHYAFPGQPQGLAGLKQSLAMIFTAFPDCHETVEDRIAEGDMVVARATFRATHLGPFLGNPPSGRKVAFTVIDIARIVEGKVIEAWVIYDQLAMLQQIGALPAASAQS